ncbi:amidohydrolase [soil metagenome]
MINRFLSRAFSLLLTLASLVACRSSSPASEEADLIVYNAQVYTVDAEFSVAEAFAVRDGKFLQIGSSEAIRQKYQAGEEVDAQGQPVYPGFIDAHCHFYRYALGLREADLTAAPTFAEVVRRLVEHQGRNPDAAWITGRGWDQNLWPGQQFPVKDTLDLLFPNTPVFLTRVDGHAALANQRALELGQVTAATPVSGGQIVLQGRRITGVLVDNAMSLVSRHLPDPGEAEKRTLLQLAEQNCFAVGLTSLTDAGLEKGDIDLMDAMQKEGGLQIRLYAMLSPSPENQEHYFTHGPYQTDRMHVRSFKVYGDGALGSRGACLLQPYHDQSQHYGFLLQAPEEFRRIAQLLYEKGFQMNTHAIGDSTNRYILDVYRQTLKGKNDRRWRIEHAQVVHPADVPKFGLHSILPSIQPTHATSDMYWAPERLGPERISHAYPYQDLLRQNNLVPLGSDFPVEDINPLYGFHAAVARQDAQNFPAGGFQPQNALSREEALRGMTGWAAYASFEETLKGSIEAGKFADFVVLETDLMQAPLAQTRTIQVMSTYVAGKKVYGAEKR